MRKMVEKYLTTKKYSDYTNLDKLFELYLSGYIYKLLSKYDKVEIRCIVNKSNKMLQVQYQFHNLFVVIDFFDDKYNAVVYYSGITANSLDKLIIDYEYTTDFTIEKLIEEIDEQLRNHPQLKDITLVEKKKKRYSFIATISLGLPFLILVSIGLYCIITKESVQGNVLWIIFFTVIPLIVWFIFDIKSKK